jgi:hypothetical protein
VPNQFGLKASVGEALMMDEWMFYNKESSSMTMWYVAQSEHDPTAIRKLS